MSDVRHRYVVAATLVAVAGIVFAVASRSPDTSEAIAAHAEYLVVCDARDRAVDAASQARTLGGDLADADRLAAEAGEHAERLLQTWGQRWRRLGLTQ